MLSVKVLTIRLKLLKALYLDTIAFITLNNHTPVYFRTKNKTNQTTQGAA